MVIHSGKRSFYPEIERTVQNMLVRLIPYKGENLVYTRVRNHFSLFVVQSDETLPLLKPLIVNAFGGCDIEGVNLPDLVIYCTQLANVSKENGIDIVVEGTRDYQLVTNYDFWDGIGSGEIDFMEVMKDVIPNGMGITRSDFSAIWRTTGLFVKRSFVFARISIIFPRM